jgi:hypothetical protein
MPAALSRSASSRKRCPSPTPLAPCKITTAGAGQPPLVGKLSSSTQRPSISNPRGLLAGLSAAGAIGGAGGADGVGAGKAQPPSKPKKTSARTMRLPMVRNSIGLALANP